MYVTEFELIYGHCYDLLIVYMFLFMSKVMSIVLWFTFCYR